MLALVKPLDPPRSRVLQLVVSGAESAGVEVVLIGALARDLLLEHGYEIEIARATQDIDIVVAVQSWAQYEAVIDTLLELGHFRRSARASHRLELIDGPFHLDVVPCGGLESADGRLLWPPGFEFEMNAIGLREAMTTSIEVEVDEDLTLRVA